MAICFEPIGFFTTPFTEVTEMPIQPSGAKGIRGEIHLVDKFRDGLTDLAGFSHIIVLYHLHRIDGYDLLVKPFLDDNQHGVFATRSPKRPNPIGLSVLELLGIENNRLLVHHVDVLDRTPVIDIKPYIPDFDVWPAERIGWFAGKSQRAKTHRSDDRFAPSNRGEK